MTKTQLEMLQEAMNCIAKMMSGMDFGREYNRAETIFKKMWELEDIARDNIQPELTVHPKRAEP